MNVVTSSHDFTDVGRRFFNLRGIRQISHMHFTAGCMGNGQTKELQKQWWHTLAASTYWSPRVKVVLSNLDVVKVKDERVRLVRDSLTTNVCTDFFDSKLLPTLTKISDVADSRTTSTRLNTHAPVMNTLVKYAVWSTVTSWSDTHDILIIGVKKLLSISFPSNVLD